MKIRIIITCLVLFCSTALLAQLGIGTDSPDANTVVHMETTSGNKGLIIPRVITSDMRNMNNGNLAQGTLVYNTDSNEIYAFFDNAWNSLTPFYRKRDAIPVGPGEIKASGSYNNKRAVEGYVPVGGIIMWRGTTPPTNWAICNGSNGTPDLTNRFIVGTGSSYALNATGGANTVTLTTAQMPSHNHSVSLTAAGSHHHTHNDIYMLESAGITGLPAGTASYLHGSTGKTGNHGIDGNNVEFYYLHSRTTSAQPNHNHTVSQSLQGGGQAHENRPLYYSLAYIMRIK